MRKTTDLSKWASTSEAAQLLDMTQRNVRYLIKAGKLESQEIAGRLVVSRASIDLYLAEHSESKKDESIE